MTTNLTDAAIRTLAPPMSRRIEIQDMRCPGLELRVTPSGVKSWSFRYRDRTTGKTERKTLGRYPDVSLARAREIAAGERVGVFEGRSPQARIRDARRLEKKALTFDDVANRYLRGGVAHKAASTISVETAYLVSARAAFKDRKAKDISRQDVIDFLAARAVGTPVAANRTLAVLATLFGWAVERGILETTPIVKIGKPTKREIPKDRVLTEREIVALWRAFDDLDKPIAAALRLLLVTGQRPGQVAAVELGELHDLHDPEGAAWYIPAAKRKDPRGSKRGPHVVPLTQFAVEIVESALASRSPGDSSPAVFLSRRNCGAAIERNSLSQALQRLVTCLDARRLDADPSAIAGLRSKPPTPHDLRRTCATQMAALGVPREDRMAVLDHAQPGVHSKHYDHYERLAEKRAALAVWGRKLREILAAPIVKAH